MAGRKGEDAAAALSSAADKPAHVPPPPDSCCIIEELRDGSGEAIVYIPPEVLARIRNRAQTMPLGRYCWENIFRRALESHVY